MAFHLFDFEDVGKLAAELCGRLHPQIRGRDSALHPVMVKIRKSLEKVLLWPSLDADEGTDFNTGFCDNLWIVFLPILFVINIVLDVGLKGDANDNAKEALTRVVVTRADIDIKEIKEAFHKQYGVSVEDKIEKATNGNYKEFLLTLVGKGGK